MYGFIKNEEESYIYKWANGPAIVFLVLYVDDILLIGNDVPVHVHLKKNPDFPDQVRSDLLRSRDIFQKKFI